MSESTTTDVVEQKITRRHRIEYAVANFVKQRVLRASDRLFGIYQQGLFLLLYHVFRVNRKVMQANIDIAFPERSPEEKESLIRANYQWAARVSLEILRMDSRRGKLSQYISFHNLKALDEALEEEKGILLISGHFGHWEVIVPALAEHGYDMFIYVGAQSNPLVDDMHNTTRASFGATTIGKSDSARFKFMRVLRKRNILAMLPDQNDRKSDTFVNFFGKSASMSRSIAGFHIARKSPIVVSYCVFVEGQVEIHFERLHCQRTDDKEQDQLNITQQISDGIESFVRKYPDQYFWMHRRWRTRPPDDPKSVY